MAKKANEKQGFFSYVKSIGLAVLIALLFRSVIVEPYSIPSGSMIPTIVPGDKIFVQKFSYGIRLPLVHKYLIQTSTPERGDVVVFIFPGDNSTDFIKRIVGIPGDQIRFENGNIYINDQILPRETLRAQADSNNAKRLQLDGKSSFTDIPREQDWTDMTVFDEQTGDKHYLVQYQNYNGERPAFSVSVPEDHYFMVGDNRDGSNDSRYWGFVPMGHIKGKAMFIWLSAQPGKIWNFFSRIRWQNIGTWLN